MLCDYHTHTPLCLHAEGTVDDYVQAALKAGITELGIADHAPMPQEPFDDWRMQQHDLPAYFQWISTAKHAAHNTGHTIKAGLECDWVPGIESWIAHLRTLYDWDYLVGSVHYVGNKQVFDHPGKMGFWEHTPVELAWQQYWQTFTDMAQSGLFQILGHADLIKKFGFYPPGDLTPYYLPALQAIKDNGTCLEINTSGWRHACNVQYPAFDMLKRAVELDVPVTISSDAHKPSDVARDFDRALTLARQAGLKYLTAFTQGQMEFYPLP